MILLSSKFLLQALMRMYVRILLHLRFRNSSFTFSPGMLVILSNRLK